MSTMERTVQKKVAKSCQNAAGGQKWPSSNKNFLFSSQKRAKWPEVAQKWPKEANCEQKLAKTTKKWAELLKSAFDRWGVCLLFIGIPPPTCFRRFADCGRPWPTLAPKREVTMGFCPVCVLAIFRNSPCSWSNGDPGAQPRHPGCPTPSPLHFVQPSAPSRAGLCRRRWLPPVTGVSCARPPSTNVVVAYEHGMRDKTGRRLRKFRTPGVQPASSLFSSPGPPPHQSKFYLFLATLWAAGRQRIFRFREYKDEKKWVKKWAKKGVWKKRPLGRGPT